MSDDLKQTDAVAQLVRSVTKWVAEERACRGIYTPHGIEKLCDEAVGKFVSGQRVPIIPAPLETRVGLTISGCTIGPRAAVTVTLDGHPINVPLFPLSGG